MFAHHVVFKIMESWLNGHGRIWSICPYHSRSRRRIVGALHYQSPHWTQANWLIGNVHEFSITTKLTITITSHSQTYHIHHIFNSHQPLHKFSITTTLTITTTSHSQTLAYPSHLQFTPTSHLPFSPHQTQCPRPHTSHVQ